VASNGSEPRLAGRVAVITGGGSGIGLASARRLAAEGARVVIADLDRAAGNAAAAEVDGAFVAVDVSDADQVHHLFAVTEERFGRIDVSFHNAGISPPDDHSILTTGLDAWRRVQDVNLTSVYLCCQAVLPIMQRHGAGSIINTASFVATMGSATSQISYTASKGGVLALSRELGVQFARDGIRVNALCPGPVETPLLLNIFGDDPAALERRRIHWPTGRLAKPREVVNGALFLASDESSYVNGSTFLVDGGLTASYVTPE
jgi:NAD(P)-dependent dehydrogenase (short-subunit alcohol dehydrogenase family)